MTHRRAGRTMRRVLPPRTPAPVLGQVLGAPSNSVRNESRSGWEGRAGGTARGGGGPARRHPPQPVRSLVVIWATRRRFYGASLPSAPKRTLAPSSRDVASQPAPLASTAKKGAPRGACSAAPA